MRQVTILLFCALLCGACRTFDEASTDSPSGTYVYEAFDDNGNQIVRGQLHIDARRAERAHSFSLEGTWEIVRTGPPKGEIGPQSGSGRLVGSVAGDGSYWIDLNPDFRDNNVVLAGAFESRRYDSLAGDWEYVTFVGPTTGGRFLAERDDAAE